MIKHLKSSISILLLSFFGIVFLTQCEKEDIRGWSYYLEPALAPEIVSMSSSIKDCASPYPVTFFQETNNLLGEVTYLWDFGDGTTSSLQNPTHIYDSIGAFEVMLTVSNEIGSDTMRLDMSVLNQTSIPVETEFSYEHFNNNNFAPAKVIFSNTSNGSKIFDWDFGDGNQDNDDNPTHVFQDAGNYTVNLTGTCTNNDFDVYTQQIFINPAPTRIFIDSLTLMLPSSLRNQSIYVELYHNTTYVGSTRTYSPRSYPFKFYNPEDFFDVPIFQNVNFANNEIFKFLVVADNEVDEVLFEIVLSPLDIQNRHYPRAYFQIELVPPLDDVFIDLYLDY